MSYRDPRLGRIVDERPTYRPSTRDLKRADARRKAERIRDEKQLEEDLAKLYDLDCYGLEDN